MPSRIPPPPLRSPQIAALKESVRRLLVLDADTAVVIRQLASTEPGCPPLETVIAVLPMEGEPRRWTVGRAVEQITEGELRTLLAGATGGAT
ncbi:hypothetical protein [Streptomyces chattanoogensis]|uniref:Uncharacterized protein n=1 Tax=Streptomyces chattanoogensis TaxID=66876 RepID=A0A0N1JW05_9ACTN|nr:hypothetical protein [Streptomyces chattanoogensis]KPC59233.1 hypothetical protein ADL29_35780 [Streptomyces chattanoogensis]